MTRGFRLAAVQRLRARRLDEAGHELARAQRALADAAAQRDALRQGLLGCVPGPGTDPAGIRSVAERRAGLRDRIALCDTEITELTARARAARDGWLSVRADLRAVEALHERYRRALRGEQGRREQRQADDLAATRVDADRVFANQLGADQITTNRSDPTRIDPGLGGDAA